MHVPGVEIKFPGDRQGFAEAFVRLRELLDEKQLDDTARYNVELVFEEIVSNIINYGGVDGRQPSVCLSFELRDDEILLTFEDDGRPFDSTAHTPKPRPKSLADATPGGFGIVLVRRATSSIKYCRTAEGRNRLAVAIRRAVPAA